MGIFDWAYSAGDQFYHFITQTPAQPSAPSYTPPPQVVAPASNPVSQATQYYNQNYDYNRSGGSISANQPVQFQQVQAIQSAPAQRFDPVKGISEGLGTVSRIGGEIGQKAYLAGAGYGREFALSVNQQPVTPIQSAPAQVDRYQFIDKPRGIIAQPGMDLTTPKGITAYVPFGEQKQIEIPNAKVVYGETGGGVGFYQTPRSMYENEGFTRKYGFITSSGGTGALQSGMFSLAPLTPAVFTQESGGRKLAPSAVPEAAASVLASPEKFSRMGAEAYEGLVQPLDNRRLQPGQEMGRYPAATGNLANLVNPVGVNRPKEEWETMPWSIQTQGAPNIQRVDVQGRLFGITPAPAQNIVAAIGTQELKAPFISAGKSGQATEGTLLPYTKGYSPIGGLIGSAMFGEKRPEGVKGIIAGSIYTATAGFVDLSEAWGLTKTEPALETFRQQKIAQEQALTGMESYGKQKFGTTSEGQIKIDTTSPEAMAFETKYTEAKSQYEGLISTAKQQGILKVEGGQYVENPDLTYKFGEATKWGLGAGAQIRGALGFSGEQLSAYETKLNAAQVPESLSGKLGYGAERFVFGAGKVLSTHPEEIVYGVGAGAIWATGGEVVGGGLGALSEGGGRLAPLATRALAIGESPFVRYGVPAAFVGATAYSATEGFQAPLSKSLINVGGTALPLGGMLYGGMGTQAFLRSRYAGFGTEQEQRFGRKQETIQTIDLRPQIDLRPEVNLAQARTVEFGGQQGMTVAERMMIIRQFELTPHEIAVSRTRGLSLNDILSARAQPEYASVYGLEYPKQTSVLSTPAVQEFYPLEQMQISATRQRSAQLGMFDFAQARTVSTYQMPTLAGMSRTATAMKMESVVSTRQSISSISSQKQFSSVFSTTLQKSGTQQSQKQFSDVLNIPAQRTTQPQTQRHYRDLFKMTAPRTETPQKERTYRDIFRITTEVPATPVPTKQTPPTRPFIPIIPIIPIIPFGFSLPSGSDIGRGRGRFKSPFREMINIQSQLFGGKKKRRK